MVAYCEGCGKPRKIGRGQGCVMCELEKLKPAVIGLGAGEPVEPLSPLQGFDRRLVGERSDAGAVR